MARRVVVTSQKGGVGKTPIALNLAVPFAERAIATLLADLDPQGGIGFSLGKGDTELAGLAELLMGEVPAGQAVAATNLPALRLLPRGRLDPVDVREFEKALQAHGVLDRALAEVERGTEMVLIDTPSGMGAVTRAALAAADYALIPFQTENLALRSLSQALRVVENP